MLAVQLVRGALKLFSNDVIDSSQFSTFLRFSTKMGNPSFFTIEKRLYSSLYLYKRDNVTGATILTTEF